MILSFRFKKQDKTKLCSLVSVVFSKSNGFQVCVCVTWPMYVSLYGPSLEIIMFVAEWASLSSGCAVNEAKDLDYSPMSSHECMRFHLIKVCTDNCYYLFSTIWKETMLIGMVLVGRKEKRNKCVLCFHVKISPLSSLCGAVSQTLMRSLFQDQSHLSLWENIHACPHPPGSSAISLAETMSYIEDIRWTVESPLLMANLLFYTFGSSECFVMFTLYMQQRNSMTWKYFFILKLQVTDPSILLSPWGSLKT